MPLGGAHGDLAVESDFCLTTNIMYELYEMDPKTA